MNYDGPVALGIVLTRRWLQRLERLNSVTSVSPVSFWSLLSFFLFALVHAYVYYDTWNLGRTHRV
jgi:hypothetical protein